MRVETILALADVGTRPRYRFTIDLTCPLASSSTMSLNLLPGGFVPCSYLGPRNQPVWLVEGHLSSNLRPMFRALRTLAPSSRASTNRRADLLVTIASFPIPGLLDKRYVLVILGHNVG